MSYEEKGTWVYLAIMAVRVAGTPVGRVPYVAVPLWTIGASILGRVLVESARPSDSRRAAVAGSVLKLVAYRRGL